jgi:hypothetical protein
MAQDNYRLVRLNDVAGRSVRNIRCIQSLMIRIELTAREHSLQKKQTKTSRRPQLLI